MSLFRIFCFFIFTSLVFAKPGFGCSLVQAPPLPATGPNKVAYIMVGEVIGYTEPVNSDIYPNESYSCGKFCGKEKGLKIKPVESINLPIGSPDYYELYTFGVTPWCTPQIRHPGIPVGTRVRIIAYEADLLPNRNAEGKVRLQTKIFDRLSYINETDDFKTDSTSEFDYQLWKPLTEKIRMSKDSEQASRFGDFIYIEINKDLFRLQKAKNKKERYRILERLLYAPGIDYPALAESRGFWIGKSRLEMALMQPGRQVKPKGVKKSTSTEKKLLKRREEIEKSGFFKF